MSHIWMTAYVVDADVLFAAFRSDAGASRWLLEAARVRPLQAIIVGTLMLEYVSVLSCSEHLVASAAYQPPMVTIFLQFFNNPQTTCNSYLRY